MTYSIDFRKRVLKIKEREKLSFASVSERFGVGKNTVFLWSKKLFFVRSRNKPATKINTDQLIRDIEEYSDSYQYERAKRLGVSKSGICSALKRLNITYKKNFKAPEGKRRRKISISG